MGSGTLMKGPCWHSSLQCFADVGAFSLVIASICDLFGVIQGGVFLIISV